MFINLSNHPTERWEQPQLDEAKKLGNGVIFDIPFPQVDPKWDEAMVAQEVERYIEKIQYLSDGKPVIVHVMGEMGFTYRIVCELYKNKDITPVYSTTQRIVEEINGRKTSEFRFTRFRRYV